MREDFDVLGQLRFQMADYEESPPAGRRQAFRTVTSGLSGRVHGALASFAVNDISAGGICLDIAAGRYAKGQQLTIDILISDKLYLADLAAHVVRAEDKECACAFTELSRHQELKLDKLVLEMQKRFIALRKQQQREEALAEEEQTRQKAALEQENIRPHNQEPPVIRLR